MILMRLFLAREFKYWLQYPIQYIVHHFFNHFFRGA